MRRIAAGIDIVALLAFVAIGRSSHHHGEAIGGFLSTTWPFAAGVFVGWFVTRRREPASPRTGAVVCLVTVAVGMSLRVIAGQGTAVSFIIVALIFLGLTMVGGRALAGVVSRRTRTPLSPGQ